jgi:AcrR family transcriptional regulator
MKQQSTERQPTKREAQAEGRREQLLEVALQLFSERGWEGTSVKSIAERAGVAPGLMYHYFESKEDLLYEVVEEFGFVPELRRALEPIGDQPAAQALPKVIRSYYRLLEEKGPVICIFVREGLVNPDLHEKWVRMMNEAVHLLATYFDRRVAAGELKPHNTEVSARMVLHPVAMMQLVGAHPDRLGDVVEVILHGVARKPGARSPKGGRRK